ncbi:MAG: hypothetical protein EHM88_03375 [Candidatus Rokuibacteriota bacterium]|nr:MAG: hypothetical protein EHM88_03375 [Candidatus Rokubacteria bacterium]
MSDQIYPSVDEALEAAGKIPGAWCRRQDEGGRIPPGHRVIGRVIRPNWHTRRDGPWALTLGRRMHPGVAGLGPRTDFVVLAPEDTAA